MDTRMEKAERISISVESCAEELMDKLCEGEDAEVRRAAWLMFATRVAMGSGIGLYLPPVA